LPSISNFSDFDPLENEESILIEWIGKSQNLKKYDIILLPGSKQTIKDQIFLENSGLSKDIREYSNSNGNIVGICGGLQMLGTILEDPYSKEGSKNYSEQKTKGIGLLPLKTTFLDKKITRQINSQSLWPCQTKINGFSQFIKNAKIMASKVEQDIPPIKPSIVLLGDIGDRDVLPNDFPMK